MRESSGRSSSATRNKDTSSPFLRHGPSIDRPSALDSAHSIDRVAPSRRAEYPAVDRECEASLDNQRLESVARDRFSIHGGFHRAGEAKSRWCRIRETR